MNETTRKQLTNRLRRISGQVTGVQNMIDEDRYCVDVLTQIAAIRSSLDALGVELLTKHLESCVLGDERRAAHPSARGSSKAQLLAEVRTTLSRFLK